MTFSAYVASLKAKGLPFAVLWAGVLVAAEVRSPGSDHWCLAALDGAGARCSHRYHALAQSARLLCGRGVSASAECGPLPHTRHHGGPAVLLREWAGGLELERQQCWPSGKGLITPSPT